METQRNHHQRNYLAGGHLLSFHCVSENQTLVSLIEKGDVVTWLWRGIEYAGQVTEILASRIICAVTPDKKEWTVRMDEIVDFRQTDKIHG